jgi:hypothetical protein
VNVTSQCYGEDNKVMEIITFHCGELPGKALVEHCGPCCKPLSNDQPELNVSKIRSEKSSISKEKPKKNCNEYNIHASNRSRIQKLICNTTVSIE